MRIDIGALSKRVHAVFPGATLTIIGDESQFRYTGPLYYIELVVRNEHHARIPLTPHCSEGELAHRLCGVMVDYLIRRA